MGARPVSAKMREDRLTIARLQLLSERGDESTSAEELIDAMLRATHAARRLQQAPVRELMPDGSVRAT